MSDTINWKQVYHWANVILIPLWGISAIIMNSNSGASPVLFYMGCAWIIISGIINQRVRDLVLKFLGKFFGSIGIGTVVVSCLLAGFALLFVLIIIGLLATLIATVGLLVLAVYLFATSAQALIIKVY